MQELRQQVMHLKAALSKFQAEAEASAGAQTRQAALMGALEQELGTLREQVGSLLELQVIPCLDAWGVPTNLLGAWNLVSIVADSSGGNRQPAGRMCRWST
jgi:hypothetical protein